MAIYVPRVLLCGEEKIFRQTIGDKPAEVVGQIIFEHTGDKTKLFLDGQELSRKDILQLLNGKADYLLFVDVTELTFALKDFSLSTQVMSANAFARKIHDGFFSSMTLLLIANALNEKIFGRVLDFDYCFAKGDFRTGGNFKFELDGLAENFRGKIYPIHENLYRKIYRTFDECKYRHFGAILFTAERSPDEFVDVLIETADLAENVWAFARKNSPLESWLNSAENFFAAVEKFPTDNGACYLLKKRVSPVDLCVYVVTHKDAQIDALPEGYKFIHAGHAQAKKDFGYIGDDTGDNISRLNHFLDEVTALYWIWKNTSHTHTGFVHYRRFFTLNTDLPKSDTGNYSFSAENILSAEEILKLLDEYDIIVRTDYITDRTQREMMIFSTNSPELVEISEMIVRKHLTRTHPDYLDAFDEVMGGFMFFLCGIHIARRNVFNAWCEWLFSFILDATAEIRAKVQIGGVDFDDVPHYWSRMMSFFAERLLTVWLMKNHLRIKPLPIMFRDDV